MFVSFSLSLSAVLCVLCAVCCRRHGNDVGVEYQMPGKERGGGSGQLEEEE
jgi:hypothetical protein